MRWNGARHGRRHKTVGGVSGAMRMSRLRTATFLEDKTETVPEGLGDLPLQACVQMWVQNCRNRN